LFSWRCAAEGSWSLSLESSMASVVGVQEPGRACCL
jgi:hypothetical protein